MLSPNKFEGDINMNPMEVMSRARSQSIMLYNALRNRKQLWDEGKIPFIIRDAEFDNEGLDLIKTAMKKYHDNTCIK